MRQEELLERGNAHGQSSWQWRGQKLSWRHHKKGRSFAILYTLRARIHRDKYLVLIALEIGEFYQCGVKQRLERQKQTE